MKTVTLLTLVLLLLASGRAQIPVLYYDFENNTARTSFENAAEQSVNAGSSSLVRWFSGGSPNTSTPAGAGLLYGGSNAGTAFSSNRWPSADPGVATNAYLGFNTNTVGFNGLTLSFDAMTNQSGLSVAVAWSTNNSTFTASSTGALPVSTSFSTLHFALPASAENQSTLYIKIYAFNSANQNGTKFTIDNLTLNAATISASKTLLNYAEVGLSLTSGSAYDPPYNNLAITGVGTTAVLDGNLLLQGTLSLTAGTFSLGNHTLMMNGTISQGSGVIHATAGTISYGGTASQTVNPAHFTGAINNLAINNTAGVWAGGNLAVGNTLTLTTGTLTVGTNTLTIGGHVSRSTGVLNAATASVQFNGTAPQSIAAGVFSGTVLNFTINNAAGVSTAADVTIAGTLALTSGTYHTGTSTQTIQGNVVRTAGAIHAASGTVVLNGSVVQTIPAGVFTGSVLNLTVNNAAGINASADVTITGTLMLTNGTYNIGSSTHTISGAILSSTGRLNAASGSLVFNGNVQQSIPAGSVSDSIRNLTISNTTGVSAGYDITVTGNLALHSGQLNIASTTLTIPGTVSCQSGAINAASGTVVFNGGEAQSIPADAFSGALNNLVINNSGGVLAAANLTVAGTLSLTAGIFSLGTTTLTMKGNISRLSGAINAAAGAIVFNGPAAQAISSGVFSGGVQTLVINNTAGVSTLADMTITGTLTLSGGTYYINGSTQTIQGNISAAVGTIDASSGTLVLKGSAPQTIHSGVYAGSIRNLTVNNPSGVTTNANTTITGTLNLVAGTYNIGNSVQTITGTISSTAGLLDASAGTLVMSGASAQSLPAGGVTTAIKNITINNAAGVTINENHTILTALVLQAGFLHLNGKTLTIGGTVSGPGLFRGSELSGLTIASSTAAGVLLFDQTTDGSTNALGTLLLSTGSAALDGKLNIYTALNVAGGSLDLAGQNLVLKSLPSNTAKIAPVTGTIINASNVTVERWFPNHGRRWRMITPGVTTTTSIRQNWMEGGMNTAFCATCNVDPNPGYGTQITGSGGTVNGFDATPSNSASLYLYNQQANGWTPVTSTSGNLSASTPYLIFIRGDRSVDMTANNNSQLLLPGSSTVLRATGSVHIGTITVSTLAGAGKTSFISNPYPSPVSWASIYANNGSNFENYYTYWDPKIGQRGAYVTVTNTGLNNNTSSSATEEIQSGQGFFVTTKTGVSSPSLVIREQDKSTTANVNVFRTAKAQQTVEKLYAGLNFTVPTGEKFNADGVLVAFGPQFSNSLDKDDAVQLANWDEDIAITREGKALSIETRNALQDSDTIQLSIARLKTGVNYEWLFTPIDMAGFHRTGYLVDKFLKKETPVKLGDSTAIPFVITPDAASYRGDRFMVVFRAANTTLPLRFVSVSARQKAEGPVEVEWQTTSETNTDRFEVQKSLDGKAFIKLAVVLPKGGSTNSYNLTDGTVAEGKNIYRVKSIDRDGAVRYSNVVMITIQKQKNGLAVFPNPLKGTALNLQLGNPAKGTYTLQVKNAAGISVFARQLQSAEVNGQAVQLPETLATGWYIISLAGPDREEQTVLIKQ